MIIIGGDFNTIQNGKLDQLPPERGPNTKKSRVLNNLRKELGLIDPWKVNNPKSRDFTFYSNPHGSYSRIDFFCVSKQQVHKITNCSIESITISDHTPVVLSLQLGRESFLKYWRLNVSLLSDEKVIQELKKSSQEIFSNK